MRKQAELRAYAEVKMTEAIMDFRRIASEAVSILDQRAATMIRVQKVGAMSITGLTVVELKSTIEMLQFSLAQARGALERYAHYETVLHAYNEYEAAEVTDD